jgi:hypothetical protein
MLYASAKGVNEQVINVAMAKWPRRGYHGLEIGQWPEARNREANMPVTKEMLRAMLESLGGLDMTDDELEKAVPQVQIYADQAAKLQALDLSEVYSGRLLHPEEGTTRS